MARVKVYLTFDVEVWPGAWTDIDSRFPRAFRQYVYGDTPQGQYALPKTLSILGDHGLHGVFFVEPMFSSRFGVAPLAEIIGLIREARQEVQMHLHAEWVNEARERLLDRPPGCKLQHLSYFSREDQCDLVAWAKRRLNEAGAGVPTAFRAGSFRFNEHTLAALAANSIHIDSSYNHCSGGPESGVWRTMEPGNVPVVPFMTGGVIETPVTVYRDSPLGLRPLQITACSFEEIAAVLRKAADHGYPSVTIVSHNFEMLDRRDFSCDKIVAQRFRKLCQFLARHGDVFETAGFRAGGPEVSASQPVLVSGSFPGLLLRYAQQLQRRIPGIRYRGYPA